MRQRNKNNNLCTHSSAIWSILKGIGWPTDIPKFDPEYELKLERYEICQLVPGTKDGFPEFTSQLHPEIGPDPPWQENFDLPYDGDARDPHHWTDYSDQPHWGKLTGIDKKTLHSLLLQ